jgi:hypothetical protein
MSLPFTFGDELLAVITAAGSGAASSIDSSSGQGAAAGRSYMNNSEIIASLVAVLSAAGVDADRGAYLLRRTARELALSLPTPNHATIVSPLVHAHLWLAVLAGDVDEEVAIDRTRQAALASTEEEREAILFPVPTGDEAK